MKHTIQKRWPATQGLSLVEVMIIVGVLSAMVLAIASASSMMINSQSLAQNFGAAAEAQSLATALLGDPAYCAIHFRGLPLKAAPSVISDLVELKDITNAGTLGTGKIIGPGVYFENRIRLQEVKLKANTKLAPNRFLGELEMTFLPNQGLLLKRTVGLLFSTDANDKVESCSRLLQPLPDATRGLYSEDCSDFGAKGWTSKLACQQDGRWHVVYTNSATGAAVSGSRAELESFIDMGASIKVGIPSGTAGFSAAAENCQSTARVGPNLACMSATRVGIPDWVKPSISPTAGVVYFTSGVLIYEAPETKVNIPMRWMIKF